MFVSTIKNVLLSINKDDLIEFNMLKYDNLTLIRLNSSDFKMILSKLFETDVNNVEIIDYLYYSVQNDEIHYEIKFYLKDIK